MRLKKIKLENIRSYENQEINFPEGSILLSGDIGVGKTSVLLAIEFALFGLQPSQRGSSLLKNGKNEGRVVLELEIEGKSIVLERTLKKSGKTIAQDYTSISIDNEKFEGSVTEIKTRVLDLLSYPSEFAKKTNLLYKFTVYTPQEEMKQIILEGSETRLNTLRHIFGIDKYKRIEENLAVYTSKLREEIRNKEGMLSDADELNKQLEERKTRLLSLKQNKEQVAKILQQKKEERGKIEQEVKQVEDKVKEKQELEKEKDKTSFMLNNKKESSFDLDKQIEKLRKEITEGRKITFNQEKFEELIKIINRNKEQEKLFQERIINLRSQLNSLVERKKESIELQEKISKLEKCPTCLQDVDASYKNNIFQKVDEELSSIKEKTEVLEKEKSQTQESIESLRKQLSILENNKSEEEIKKVRLENLKEKEEQEVELQTKKRQMVMDIETMLKNIKIINEKIGQFSKFDFLFRQKEHQLEEKRREEREQEIKVAELNKEFSLIQQQVSEIEIKIKQKQQLKKKVEYLKTLEAWLSSKFLNLILFTEKNVMLKLREEFSKLFSEWFSVLVPESLSVRLDERFSPIIQQQDYEISYAYLSGGERTAVALAYRLSLNQVINSLLSRIKTRELIILDEPTDGFSESQLDKMRDVLSQLKFQQLILVSHEAKIESFVENIIKFSKENNVTKVN